MRHALFAVVLVAASFAGGAVVNGPGLHWAQTMVLTRLGIESDNEAADTQTDRPLGGGSHEEIPARPIPPLIIEPPTGATADKERDKTKPASPEAAPKAAPAERVADRGSRHRDTAPTPPGALPGLAPVPEADVAPPPLDPPAPLVSSRERDHEALSLAKATKAPSGSLSREDPAVRPVSLGEVSSQSLPTAAITPVAALASTLPNEPNDWSAVRKALQDLGVTRYGIEGEVNGRARFHCVIPLAGRRAVGQHFEAEGDDELQAARVALRRISLWRATEAAGHNP